MYVFIVFNLINHDVWFVCFQSKQEIHRRSARLRSTKYKAPASEKKVSTKGKGRRHIFKLKNVINNLFNVYKHYFCKIISDLVFAFLQPIKAPESVATFITSESVFYKVELFYIMYLYSDFKTGQSTYSVLIFRGFTTKLETL